MDASDPNQESWCRSVEQPSTFSQGSSVTMSMLSALRMLYRMAPKGLAKACPMMTLSRLG